MVKLDCVIFFNGSFLIIRKNTGYFQCLSCWTIVRSHNFSNHCAWMAPSTPFPVMLWTSFGSWIMCAVVNVRRLLTGQHRRCKLPLVEKFVKTASRKMLWILLKSRLYSKDTNVPWLFGRMRTTRSARGRSSSNDKFFRRYESSLALMRADEDFWKAIKKNNWWGP